jgi:iron complex transport system substrate-binding protein
MLRFVFLYKYVGIHLLVKQVVFYIFEKVSFSNYLIKGVDEMKQVLKALLLLLMIVCMIAASVGCSAPTPAQAPLEEASTEQVAVETPANEEKTITLTDNVGRVVELPFPVEKAVVALRYNNELIRACGAIDQVIAADMNTAQDRAYWENFDPENTIGKSQKALNYEKIIELNPQVLILPGNGTYEEAEEKLGPFGIKVFVISGYDTNDFENQIDNIGAMFDKKDEANQFKAYYNDTLGYIATQLEGVEKKTVYWESTKDYKTSFPGNYYYNMIVASGGENIFSDAPEGQSDATITPEDVVLKNPDFIFKHITPNDALKGTGVYVAPSLEQRKQTIAEVKARPGWDEITAVKNDDVYLMSQFGHGGASKMIGAVYMAKWMYPEALKDLDPDAIFKEWLEDYQGFEFIDGHFYPLEK